jgi:lysophospholipase L1-like esterase
MIDCLILGDSIAVGTQMARPECVAYAKGGINTWQWNNKYLTKDLSAKTVIISLGSNDHKGVKTRKELENMREVVKGSRVYWILPAGNLKAGGVDIKDIQNIVRDIAQKNGDIVLPITRLQKDGIHPSGAGYKELANSTK